MTCTFTFTGGPVVKALPSNARGTVSIPCQGAKISIPCGQKTKTWSRNNIVTNSIKTPKKWSTLKKPKTKTQKQKLKLTITISYRIYSDFTRFSTSLFISRIKYRILCSIYYLSHFIYIFRSFCLFS